MIPTVYKGEKGIFFPQEEFEELKMKILAQKELIQQFEKELKI